MIDILSSADDVSLETMPRKEDHLGPEYNEELLNEEMPNPLPEE